MNKYIIILILLITIGTASASTISSSGLKTIEINADGSVKLDNSDVVISISNPEITVGEGMNRGGTVQDGVDIPITNGGTQGSTDTFSISGGDIPIVAVDNAITYNGVLTLDTQTLKWIDEFGNVESEFAYNPAQKDSLDNTITKYSVWQDGVNVRLSFYKGKIKQDTFLANLDKGLTDNSRLVETSMLTTDEPITTDAGEWQDDTSVNEIHIDNYVLPKPYIYDEGTESISYGFYHIYSVDGQKYVDVVSDIYGNWSSYVNPVLDPTVATYAYQWKNSGTANNPNSVFADACYINTDPGRECWVIHNISVSNFPIYTNVIDAYYTFTVSNYFAAGYGAFYAIDTAWNHSTVTYNTRPTRGVVLNSSVYFSSTGAYNVTGTGIKELVTSWINGTKTNNGIEVIKTGAGSPNIVLGAITLVITYDSTALPTPPSYGAISNTTTLGNTDLLNVINNTYYQDNLTQVWNITGQNQDLYYNFSTGLNSTWRGVNLSYYLKTSDTDENYTLSMLNYTSMVYDFIANVQTTSYAFGSIFKVPVLYATTTDYRQASDGNMSLKFTNANPDNDTDNMTIDLLNILLVQAPATPVLTNNTPYSCQNLACTNLSSTNISGAANYYWQYRITGTSTWLDWGNTTANTTLFTTSVATYYDFRTYVNGTNGLFSNVSTTLNVFVTAQASEYWYVTFMLNAIQAVQSSIYALTVDIDNEVDALTASLTAHNNTLNQDNTTINAKLDAILANQTAIIASQNIHRTLYITDVN